MRGGWRVWAVVMLLLGVMAGEMALSARRESLSWDEGDHLFAGYMSLRTGDFGLNPEHPPMAKMVAALPLLALPLTVPKLQGRFFKDEAYFDGRELLFRNGPANGGVYSADTLLFRARMAVSVFALALALLVFFAGREMFGAGAGLLAMALLVLEPSVLTHGPFVTTDSAISCLFFGTVWALYRYVKKPSVGRLAVTGVAAGLALAAKHSAVVLLPVLVLLLAGEVVARWRRARGDGRVKTTANPSTAPLQGFAQDDPSSGTRTGARRARMFGGVGAYALRLGGSLLAIAAIAVAVLWAFYGFRYAARPGALRLDPTLAQYVAGLKPTEAKGILLFARLHLLPESWLYGLADVRRVANWMPTFLFGKVYAHGVWVYFPSVLLIKLTLGSMGLLLLAGWAAVTGRMGRTAGPSTTLRSAQDAPAFLSRDGRLDDPRAGDGWSGGAREVWFLLVPAAVYLLVAMNSQLNIGVRHVLPVLPFLLVFAAGGAWALARNHRSDRLSRRWAYVAGALFVAHAASSLWAFPNYLPYANEAWGGSSKTYLYLSDSNADWGQQLKTVSAYLRANGITDCWFGYFVTPFIEPKDYGIPCRLLPTFDTNGEVDLPVPPVVSGVVLMSAGDENGFEFGTKVRNPYQGLMERTPDAVIDHGVLVFRGTFAIPLAAAMAPTQRSVRLLKHGDVAGAVREAQAAVAVAPASLDALMQLGKAEAQAGATDSAREAYGRALALVGRMEPSAQTQWRPIVEEEARSLKR